MNLTLKRALMSGVMATSLISATLLPVKPASADQNFWRDVGIGAGVGIGSSIITGHKVVPNVINGAAAGAAVNQSRDLTTPKGKRPDALRDAAVGAGASTLTGQVTGRRHNIRHAANGAAVRTVINILTPNVRR